MKISKEQKEAIEYLEKYTKWETYGERNLEKDIITVLELLRNLYNDNIRYEKELHDTLKYSISKEKVKDKIEHLEDYIAENSDEQGYLGNINPDVIYGQIEILEEISKEREE